MTPPLPGGHSHYVLIETSGNDPERDAAQFEAVLGEALEQGIVLDATIAASKAQAAGIWKIRDDIEGLFQHTLPAVTFDVSLPIVAMQDYVRGIEAEASAAFGSDFKFVVFGHIGDGNLHIVLGTQPFTDQTRHRIEEIVYSPLKALGGSISAEHGIGLEKRDWLTMCRSDAEIALMRTLKTAMDPKGILNPGKVLA